MLGKFTCRSLVAGNVQNFNVYDSGVANFPLGNPTFSSALVYPDVGGVEYSSETGLGISSGTTPSEGFSKVDSWLDTYLLDSPPHLLASTTAATSGYVEVAWSLPVQKRLNFGTYIPQISQVKADVVPSASNTDRGWSSNVWTVVLEVVTGKPTVTSLKIMLDYNAYQSNLSNGTYTYCGTSSGTRILPETAYDVRVYAVNDATSRAPRYTYFYNLATLPAGTPSSPLNLVVSSVTTTTAFADWDVSAHRDTVNLTTSPFISQYQVNVVALGASRFGGVLTTHTTPQSTGVSTGADAVSNLTLTTLNPGTDYSVTVQAKNTLNTSFGDLSTAALFTTLLPTAPSWASTALTLSNQATLVYGSGSSGYTLDGLSLRSPVLRYSLLQSTNPRTSTKTSVRTNYVVGDTSAVTGVVQVYAGAVGSESVAHVQTVGYGTSFLYTNQNVDNGPARLYVTAEGDYYTGASSGFYKFVSVYAEAVNPSTYYLSSDSPYNVYVKFSPTGGSVVTTNSVTFYVDALNSLPSVTFAGVTAVDGTLSYVTGVPTIPSTAVFHFRTTVSSLAHRFLRSDKLHFTAVVESSSGSQLSSTLSVSKATVDGATHSYYSPPSQSYQVSSTKHNTSGAVLSVSPGDVQFNDFTLTLSSASSVFNNALQLRVVPYNLAGTGSAYTKSGCVSVSDGTSTPVRIDTVSTSVLQSMSGTLVQAGLGQYPTSGYTSVYSDHTASIVNTDQLQLVNGKWSTPSVGDGYKDYRSYYFPNSPTLYDYSSILSTGYRYVCVRFSNLKVSTYDSVNIGFLSSGLVLTPANDGANFRLYMKVVGTTTTPWVSCTAAINPSGYDAISGDGQGAMNNGSSSISSGTGTVSVYVPTATAASATIYLRFGLDVSMFQWVSSITCTAV